MKSLLPPLVLAALAALPVLSPSAALADSPATRQWVLATAKATGANGEAFVSSLRIVNPYGSPATVSLTYLPQSPIDGTHAATGDNSARVPVTVSVGAGQTLAIEDVVGTTFGGSAPFGIVAGGIQVESDVPVSVLSRTFVANARSATGVAGTFGFSIPAQVATQAVAVGDTAYIPYISSAAATTSGFRSNFIMLSTTKDAASVLNVKLVRGNGAVVGERDYTLGRLSAAQQGNIASALGASGDDTNLTVVATVKSGGPVVIGTSIIDNAISSINYAPPTKIARPDGRYGLVLTDSYSLSGRLDVSDGEPTYLSATIVLEGCANPSSVAYVMQAFTIADPPPNTTFTRNADGSFTFTGADASASWTGSVGYEPDGSVTGNLTYSRGTGGSDPCAGRSATVGFAGSRGAP